MEDTYGCSRSDPVPRIFCSDQPHSDDSLPLKISWLDLSQYGNLNSLGISALPGCRFKNILRNLNNDIEMLKSEDVKEVFVLCTDDELNTQLKMPHYLQSLVESDLIVYHFPVEDGRIPEDPAEFLRLLDDMKKALADHKCLIHCLGGVGRSCTVASCLVMYIDPNLGSHEAMEIVRSARAAGSLFSVKQYNFINDFQDIMAQGIKE